MDGDVGRGVFVTFLQVLAAPSASTNDVNATQKYTACR
jgi:hypothetical protein